jgi:hypothetical protein
MEQINACNCLGSTLSYEEEKVMINKTQFSTVSGKNQPGSTTFKISEEKQTTNIDHISNTHSTVQYEIWTLKEHNRYRITAAEMRFCD